MFVYHGHTLIPVLTSSRPGGADAGPNGRWCNGHTHIPVLTWCNGRTDSDHASPSDLVELMLGKGATGERRVLEVAARHGRVDILRLLLARLVPTCLPTDLPTDLPVGIYVAT